MNKKSIIVFVILVLTLAAVAFFYQGRWMPGPLLSLMKELNKKASQVYATGEDSIIVFKVPDNKAIIVISPPYNPLENDTKLFSSEVLKNMQEMINQQETGHLFYILNN